MLHTFEAIQSVDFNKFTKDLMVLGNIADIDRDKFNELRDEFDLTLRNLGRLNPEFNQLREELGKTGKMTPELQAKFFELRDKVSGVGSALKALTNNSKEMVKQQNRLTQALPKVPYQDMLALMQSNVQQYKELNKAGEDYESQLVSETNKIKIYTHFQKQAVDLQKQMSSVKFSKAFNSLAGGTTRDKQLKVEEKRLKVGQEIHKLDMINLQIEGYRQRPARSRCGDRRCACYSPRYCTGRLYRRHRGWSRHRAPGRRKADAGLARTGRQVADHRVRGCPDRPCGKWRDLRHFLVLGRKLHRGFPPVRAPENSGSVHRGTGRQDGTVTHRRSGSGDHPDGTACFRVPSRGY